MTGATILVTGGAGYVGSHACLALRQAGYTPVVYDNLFRGHRWAVRFGPFEEGDYFFVHAGVRPGVPLDRQAVEDMLWIRDEFLDFTGTFGRIVVHGHTITDAPEVRDNRIGIDTGAFATGQLTCLVLEGSERRFLST